MIDISKATPSQSKAQVVPSDNIFSELGNNTYDFKDLLSELIDNCIAQRIQGSTLNVTIEFFVDNAYNPKEFIISDNAKGIPRSDIGLCISPAGKQSTDGLNEHGLGMKQAIAAMGTLKYLATKTKDEAKGYLVKKFAFGEIDTFDVDFPGESGTVISIENLKPIVSANPTSISRGITLFLGARYRKYLRPGNKLLNLTIEIKDFATGNRINIWDITEVKQIFFHPATRTNQPVIQNFEIEGDGWKADLTFGYAPANKNEYEELGLEPVNKFHPYNVSLSRQGLDIILHDRVILFSQLSEIGIVNARHNDYNVIRGEINLKSGFKTAITKNSIIADTNFIQCISKISKILRGEEPGPGDKTKEYLKLKTFPEELPEALLRDRLAEWLKTNPLNRKTNVNTEYVVEGVEGYIDILADNEAWELKVHQANALDVYQLFMYMDIADINKGFLIAKGFSTGADVAKQKIQEKHSKEIILSNLDQFPINHQPNDLERENYY